MSANTVWRNRLGFRLGLLNLAMLVIVVGTVGTSVYSLQRIEQSTTSVYRLASGRWLAVRTLALLERLPTAEPDQIRVIQTELVSTMESIDARYRDLLGGANLWLARGESPNALVAGVREREEVWRSQIRPEIERAAAAGSIDPTRLASLRSGISGYVGDLDADVEALHQDARGRVDRIQMLQYILAAVAALTLIPITLVIKNVTDRTRRVARVAERIAAGDWDMRAEVGGEDELAALGAAFDNMTGQMRATIETEQTARSQLETLFRAMSETVNSLAAATAQILSSTTEQAAGVQQQAAAVAETVTTVNEVLQMSDEAARRARAVSESAQRVLQSGTAGRKAVEETIQVLDSVHQWAESMAGNILELAEQAQAIGEIIATVNEIAEQTNILALNAAIEASRAGEHGKGFSVVASEVKALAGQSKRATAQVRQILGDIQKATNSAVIATEEGTKSVGDAIKVAAQAGETIRMLADNVSESSDTATQIAATSEQQVAGMTQIHQAMKNIDVVTNQNLTATKQTEHAAQDLSRLGGRLKEMLHEVVR